MKSQSNVVPDKIWIKSIDGNTATVVLRKDILKNGRRDKNDELQTYYEYDEVTVELVNRPQLEGYVEQHFDELFMIGEQFEYEKSLPNNNDVLVSIITSLLLEIDSLKLRIDALEVK